MSDEIKMESVVTRSDVTFSQNIDNDVVILHVESGEYFGTELVGQYIWNLIETPRSVANICDSIASHFEIAASENFNADIIAFLNELSDAKLIDVSFKLT